MLLAVLCDGMCCCVLLLCSCLVAVVGVLLLCVLCVTVCCCVWLCANVRGVLCGALCAVELFTWCRPALCCCAWLFACVSWRVLCLALIGLGMGCLRVRPGVMFVRVGKVGCVCLCWRGWLCCLCVCCV